MGTCLSDALVDALAGAITRSGTHYPEDDPDDRNARSLEFVREFGAYVRNAGFEIGMSMRSLCLGTVAAAAH